MAPDLQRPWTRNNPDRLHRYTGAVERGTSESEDGIKAVKALEDNFEKICGILDFYARSHKLAKVKSGLSLPVMLDNVSDFLKQVPIPKDYVPANDLRYVLHLSLSVMHENRSAVENLRDYVIGVMNEVYQILLTVYGYLSEQDSDQNLAQPDANPYDTSNLKIIADLDALGTQFDDICTQLNKCAKYYNSGTVDDPTKPHKLSQIMQSMLHFGNLLAHGNRNMDPNNIPKFYCALNKVHRDLVNCLTVNENRSLRHSLVLLYRRTAAVLSRI